MPRDVVVVIPCPACYELVIMFRDKVIGLKRKILEEGTLQEKKAHLAEVIAEFLEPGLFGANFDLSGERLSSYSLEKHTGDSEKGQAEPDDSDESEDTAPISQSEVDKFVRIDLKCIDDAAYFRKHFG